MKKLDYLLGIVLIFSSSCGEKPSTSQDDEYVKSLEAEILRLKSQPANATELSRETASNLIRERLKTPKSTIQFSPEGLKLALREGFVFDHDPKASARFYSLTPKARQKPGLLELLEKTQLGGYHEGSGVFFLIPKQPVAEDLHRITGVTSAGSHTAQIEYETKFNFPSPLESLAHYFYSGGARSAIAQRYDDGWRLTPER